MKTQISFGICPVSSEYWLCALWVAKDQTFFRWIMKLLIRLGGCSGWSEFSLGTQVILLVSSWSGFCLSLSTKPYLYRFKNTMRLIVNYQDQDSLLMRHRNDNHSPGPVIRELVPSSHQRSELSNTILCIFSRWDQRIGEGIPILDSLGEEATFINICIGNGSLKCHRVLIPTMPSFGDKVICWYTGFTFKTFI